MLRKLMVIALSGAIGLLSMIPALAQETEVIHAQVYQLKEYEQLTGRKLEFHEAPMLRTKVAVGELPPVEERLPEEPLVVKPVEEIGQYGGTMRRLSNEGNYNNYSMDGPYEFLVQYSPDMKKVYPNVLKDWKVDEDNKKFTLYLRKGMKWSDGHPFTADDIMFWYHDVALNKDLSPSIPSRLLLDGKPGVYKKIDDYKVEISFEKPYGAFIELLSHWRPNCYAPKHFLKQFHPAYTPIKEIEKIMKDEGFDTWVGLFQAKMGGHFDFWAIVERPVLNAWVAQNSVMEPLQTLVRNPYYWKVDTEGNQLPYIDKVERYLVNDYEGQVLKTIAGEIDLQCSIMWGAVKNHPVVMEYREDGDYRLLKCWWLPGNFGCLKFNYHSKDPILKKLFNDKRFRIALSVARNRDEINELVFGGLATPSHPTCGYGPPFYGERLFKNYLQYDPDLANQLLDEIGLTERDKEGYRLRPDGERLRLINWVVTLWSDDLEIAELDKNYWKAIGIQVVVKLLPYETWVARLVAGDYCIITYPGHKSGRPENPLFRASVVPTVSPVSASAFTIAPQWGVWLQSNGEKGEEPPDALKQICEIRERAIAESNEEKRIALTLEIFKIHEENLWTVGGLDPPTETSYYVTQNRLRNVPSYGCFQLMYSIPAQFFIKQD